MIIIGIDPGVNTGFAMYSIGALQRVESMMACEAEREILNLAVHSELFVWFEDARMRQWFGSAKGTTEKQIQAKKQGAGSIKRDCQRWQEWLEYHNIPHGKVAPKNNRTKTTAEEFQRITGWKARTNEHGRDAAMLIWSRRGISG